MMQNSNELQIDLSLLSDNAKIELFNFYRILLDKYQHEADNAQKQSSSSEKKEDILIGLFEGPPDLATRSEEILRREITQNSGWTWKRQ